jgi:hypothetical protein
MTTTLETPSQTSLNWFMPEELTPLYHAPIYSELSTPERVSYNQLHALYFHEQIIFFEQSIICPTLIAISKHCSDPELSLSIKGFIDEERIHSSNFYDLLRTVAPKMYQDSQNFFIKNSSIGNIVLNGCVAHPYLFPMYLWLILLLEERAMYCSRTFLRYEQESTSPFLSIQRQHLADEVDHVQWDEDLIKEVWPKINLPLRKLNIRFLDWMLREFIVAPKRAAVRVIDELILKQVSLQDRSDSLKKELRQLGLTPEYQRSIFCTPVAVRSERLMSCYPEFDAFIAYWFNHAN